MKKFKLFIIAAMLLLIPDLYKVHADENTIVLSGSTATSPHGMAVVNVNVHGSGLDNLSGDINYSPDELVVFSITPNAALSEWKINFDTKTNGKIKFTVNSTSAKINTDQNLFIIRFVAVNENSQGTNVTATNVNTSVKVKENVVTNQKEIDEAKANKENAISQEIADSIVIPDPIYAEKEVEKAIAVKEADYAISITHKSSSNAYLKSAAFIDGTISPAFNKLTNSYKVTIDDKVTDIVTDMVAEYPTATVEVSDEVNNQIVVTVTSENGTVNSYVFSIEREHNYTPENTATNVVMSPFETTGITFTLLVVLAAVSLGIIGIGAYYVYLGARGQ